jgi:methionyl aminopeptidase
MLDFITPYVQPGTTTDKLDRLCHEFALDNGATSAPLGYRGFPKSICTSVNHVVCHGIPSSEKVLKEGDVVNVDVTPILDGWHGDSSRMFCVGEPKIKARKLIETTYEAMMHGIAEIRPGATLGDVGHAIQAHAESQRFSVVRDFCGHGIGRDFHTPPNVLHYGEPGQGISIEEGMFFTVEPMINAGRYEVKILADQWTAVTKDRSLSAQFEHTVGVTSDGCEVFTISPKGFTCPPYET